MAQELALWPLRVAVFDRLTTHEATAPPPIGDGWPTLRDGEAGDYPHFALGPVMMGEAGTDSHAGHAYVVQVDAYALTGEGGGRVVAEMLYGAVRALGADVAVDGFDQALYMGLGSAIFTEDVDPETRKELFHGAIRFKYQIYQDDG